MEASTITGCLLRNNWELMQIEMGIIRPIQDIEYLKVGPLLTPNWLQQAWENAEELGITIAQENYAPPPFISEERCLLHGDPPVV